MIYECENFPLPWNFFFDLIQPCHERHAILKHILTPSRNCKDRNKLIVKAMSEMQIIITITKSNNPSQILEV